MPTAWSFAVSSTSHGTTTSSRAPVDPIGPKRRGKWSGRSGYIREDFFLGGSFRNPDDLNAQLRRWLETVANPRVHATQRVVNEAFAEEKPTLKPLPLTAYRTVLKLERRVSHEGMVSVGGNLYSVPDATRRRILEHGVLIATHVPLEGCRTPASYTATSATTRTPSAGRMANPPKARRRWQTCFSHFLYRNRNAIEQMVPGGATYGL